eukprot:g4331.t1
MRTVLWCCVALALAVDHDSQHQQRTLDTLDADAVAEAGFKAVPNTIMTAVYGPTGKLDGKRGSSSMVNWKAYSDAGPGFVKDGFDACRDFLMMDRVKVDNDYDLCAGQSHAAAFRQTSEGTILVIVSETETVGRAATIAKAKSACMAAFGKLEELLRTQSW